MADTIVTDAARVPHDEGLPNIADGNEDWGSAGLQMLLSQAVQSGSYVRSDGEMTFTNHDGANDQADVSAGVAYIALTGETVDVQSVLGGSSAPNYDTTITAATMPAICCILPNATTVALQDSTLSDVWLAYATDGTVSGVSAGDIYLRSDDTGSVTAPPHPSVKLGEVNPDDSTADVLDNRFGSPTFDSATMHEALHGGIGDGVDYLNPFWLPETDYFYHIYSAAADLYLKQLSGSGQVSNIVGRLELATGSTSGSHARCYSNQAYGAGAREGDWAKDNKIRFSFRNLDDDTDMTMYINNGQRVQNDLSSYGLKMENGDLHVFSYDGSTESLSTLISNPGIGNFDVFCEYDAGEEVRANVNGNTASVTSNLPTGATGAVNWFELHVENHSGVDRRIRCTPVQVVMGL